MSKSKIVGFIVVDHCEQWEQPLGIKVDKSFPAGGTLDWVTRDCALFPDRKSARAAIDRTEHYRLAFGLLNMPEKRNCKIIPVSAV